MKKLIFLFLLSACAGAEKDSIVLESQEAHNAAIKISEQIEMNIESITKEIQDMDSSNSMFQDSLTTISNDYEAWVSSIVEVPGDDHDHHHHHHDHGDHEGHHHHDEPVDVTPETMLEIQKELKNSAIKLEERTQALLQAIAASLENEDSTDTL